MEFRGLNHFKEGSVEPGDSKCSNTEPPLWYDHEKFLRGQRFFCKHVTCITFSMHVSLVTGMSIINLLEPLVFTGKSNTPDKSIKRYMMTFYHIFLWMTEDVWDKNSKAYKSLHTVRNMHNSTAAAMNKNEKTKLYVSQYDLALVQTGFYGAVVMYPKQCGVNCTWEELDDYIFTWRVIGYLLGIKDKYNTCSGYKESYFICKEIEEKKLMPALLNPPKHFAAMADAYVDGLNGLFPGPIKLHSRNCVIALACIAFSRKIHVRLSILDYFRLFFWKLYFFLCYYVPFVEWFLNKTVLKSFGKDMQKLFGKDIEDEFFKYL